MGLKLTRLSWENYNRRQVCLKYSNRSGLEFKTKRSGIIWSGSGMPELTELTELTELKGTLRTWKKTRLGTRFSKLDRKPERFRDN